MDDEKWFQEHLNEIRKKFEGKLVAVLNGEIVAVADTLDEIGKIIMKRKKDAKLIGAPYIGRASEDIAAVHIPSIYI